MQQPCAIVCLFLSSSSARYKHCHSKPNDINRRCLHPTSTLSSSLSLFSDHGLYFFPCPLCRFQPVFLSTDLLPRATSAAVGVVTDSFLQAISVNVPPPCQRPVTHVKVKLWTVILCLPKLIQTKHTMYK